mmetsp:Transcript_10964/g.15139  ORF Transcript_10964/g.15139 Transcript_10964/m.15139 type:complete len:282 (+) Transcript_10964:24-869(+)
MHLKLRIFVVALTVVCGLSLMIPLPSLDRRLGATKAVSITPEEEREPRRYMLRRTAAAERLSRMHTRIVGKAVFMEEGPRKEGLVKTFAKKFVRVLGKSLLIGFIIQPAIASAAPGLQYLAYLGFGREEGELYKTQTTYHLAAPFIIAGILAARATLNERHQAEKEKIRKANEKMQQAEREFLKVDGEAESDVDIMSELRQRASNMTNATSSTAYNRGGPPPPRPAGSDRKSSPSSTAPRPREPSGGGSNSPTKGPVGRKTASADDVARLMRMMGNSSKSS